MMRMKIAFHGVILVLLVSLFSLFSSVPFLISDSQIFDTDEHAPIYSLSEGNSEANLTWTSRTQQVPQLLENESIAVGDHVVLNATFTHTQNVTECKLYIWNIQASVNTTVSCAGSSVALDTYYLDRSNQTYSIMVNGTTSTNDSVIIIWENVSICNFFAPEPIAFSTIEYDDHVFNISWNCEDQNLDDVNYFSLWLSRDGGVSSVLLEQNLTQTWFVWDSSTWLEAEYIAMIRAYSVDYSSSECRLDNPPTSYWPGDYSDITTHPINGGGVGMGGPIPSFSINTNALSYEFGSTGNLISVHLSYYNRPLPLSIVYSVTDNGTLWIQGEYVLESSEESFTINIDGLSIGTHDLSIAIDYFGPYDREYLTVVVTTPTSSNTTTTATPQDWSSFVQALAVGVSIGSVAIITIVIILSIRLRRNRVVEYV